jgi:RimJ/RimL family protein N-acetyltransferase
MEFQCDRCIVRPFQESDAETLAKHANNRQIWLNLRDGFPHPYQLSDAEAYIAVAVKQTPTLAFAVTVEGEAVGSIALKAGQDIERCGAEIGYWLGQKFWGRGIMTAAVAMVTYYGLTDLQLNRIFAVPFSENVRSARVLERVGYEQEGVMRSSAIKDGRVLDQFLYAKIRSG